MFIRWEIRLPFLSRLNSWWNLICTKRILTRNRGILYMKRLTLWKWRHGECCTINCNNSQNKPNIRWFFGDAMRGNLVTPMRFKLAAALLPVFHYIWDYTYVKNMKSIPKPLFFTDSKINKIAGSPYIFLIQEPRNRSNKNCCIKSNWSTRSKVYLSDL